MEISELIGLMGLPLLSGLGLFLLGMSIMSDGLENAAGNRLEKLIEKLSGNVLKGVLVGTIVTAVIQSSSATTVMVVGFVNAGVMKLMQAVGIIMGANIGTTVTAQLVTLDLSMLAPIAIGVGVFIKLFSRKAKLLVFGEILLGFGLLFFGMDLMKEALSPIKKMEGFSTIITSIGSGTWLGMLQGFFIGMLITAIVQSSSATTGIMVALASTGALPLDAAFPILLGTNVGTCITAILSSIGANRTAKRAALIHLLFNVIGTVIFMVVLSDFTIKTVQMISNEPESQLANAHTLFNVINTIILFPFAALLVKISEKILPITQDELLVDALGVKHLDNRILGTPQIAISVVKKEVLNMANIARDSLVFAQKSVQYNDLDAVAQTFKHEKAVNRLEHAISDYLIKISNLVIDGDERRRIDLLFNTINDIERIGDHAENIAELGQLKAEEQVMFSDKGDEELRSFLELVNLSVDTSIEAIEEMNADKARKALEYEQSVNQMEKALRKKHIQRLSEGKCETRAGILFLDLLSNLERVSDHAKNIAEMVIGDAV